MLLTTLFLLQRETAFAPLCRVGPLLKAVEVFLPVASQLEGEAEMLGREFKAFVADEKVVVVCLTEQGRADKLGQEQGVLNFGLRVGTKADLIVTLEANQFNSEPAFAQLKYL